MITAIVILSILTLVLGYTTYNLLRKNEAVEDVVQEQETLISDIAAKIDSSMSVMKDIDTRGAFESDDETGIIFKQLYDTISDLEKYYGTQEEK
jgi:hypothetical protein|tara:strand:- start:797 stop:1078 length:282 start_codon:yes stop_codon:yes gene_type:complete